MKKEKVIKIIDITILIAVAVLSAVFAFIDMLSEKYGIDYSFLACILLFAITIHFIASAFLEMDLMKKHQDLSIKIDSSTKTIINSLKGVEIKLALLPSVWVKHHNSFNIQVRILRRRYSSSLKP